MATRDTSPGAPTLDDHVVRLADLPGLNLALRPDVIVKTGAFTTTDSDFDNYALHDDVPTLHSTTTASDKGRVITFLSSAATERTILAGTATIQGNAKINQYEALSAICIATGATTATVWYLIGGSA